MPGSLHNLVVSILVWVIAILAFAASLFLAVTGLQDNDFALGTFGIAMIVVSLAVIAHRRDKPVGWLLTASFGLMSLEIAIKVVGIWGC